MEIVVRENWLTQKIDALAVAKSALVTLSLFIGSLLSWNNNFGAADWMSASHQSVFEHHQYWRLWSTLFVHADLHHLLSNSLLFFIVGIFLNGYFGALVFPTLAFLFGGVTNYFVLAHMNPTTELMGASGVVFWMGGFWLFLYLMLEVRRSFSQRLVRALGVALGLFMPAEAFDPSISYASHGWGFLLGVAAGLIYFLLRRHEFRAAEVREWIWEEDEPELTALP